jgi:integration host factor subunit beta
MTDISMTKSELIERIVAAQARSSSAQLNSKDVEFAVKTMLEQMSQTLASGDRIEIRGFGSFSLHYRAPRIGRNPKTGESVGLSGKHVPHFKPGKELRDRVNATLQADGSEQGSAPPSAGANQDNV